MCKRTKKVPFNKRHTVWWDQPQALLERFEYHLKNRRNNGEQNKKYSNVVKKENTAAQLNDEVQIVDKKTDDSKMNIS